jgi:large subunit ribosomal protein L23
MSLFKNLFKSLGRRKRPTGPRRAKGAEGEAPKTEPVKKAIPKKKDKEIYKILREPCISEKATQLSDQNKYTFKVYPNANKTQIAKAIASLYGAKVKSINIINVKPKKRVLRGIEGTKTGYKKAIVTLEKGEKIEILPH